MNNTTPDSGVAGFILILALASIFFMFLVERRALKKKIGKKSLSVKKIKFAPGELTLEEVGLSGKPGSRITIPAEVFSGDITEIERYLEGEIEDEKLRHEVALKIKELAEGKGEGQTTITEVSDVSGLPPEASSWEVSEIEQYLVDKIEDGELRHQMALKIKEFFEKGGE